MKYSTKDFYFLGSVSKANFFEAIFSPFKKLYYAIQLLIGCLKVVRNPFDTDSVIRAAQGLATPERFEPVITYLKSLPRGREVIDGREKIPNLNLDELATYPKETLGYVFAEHMKKNGLDPNFYDVGFTDDVSYLYYRYGKVHDLLHVVTGFGTSVQGEMGILSYSFAQSKGPGVMMVAALVLLHGVFFKPHELFQYVQSFHAGWTMGLRSNPYFTYDWGKALKMPLADVRAELKLAP